MSFTNLWTEVVPSDNDPANTAAAEFRKLRIDLRERMEAIIGTTHWDDDPLLIYVLNMGITGLAKILAGTTGLDVRLSDDSGSLVKVDNNGDLTLLRKFLTGAFNSNVTVDAGHTVTLNSPLVVVASQARVGRVVAGSNAIDWNGGNNQQYVTAGNTTFTFANPQTGAWYLLEVQFGGAHTLTWPASVKWSFGGTAPTPTSTNGITDFFAFYYNGTNYAGFVVGQNCNV